MNRFGLLVYRFSIFTKKCVRIKPVMCYSTTHFGNQTVLESEKQHKVNVVFDNVASKYDLMNDAMSFFVHRLWKDHFVDQIDPSNEMKCLDVAGGTGDIAFRIANYINEFSSEETSEKESNVHVTVCDINSSMIEVGKQRSIQMGIDKKISWVEGNAESLPFDDNSFDLYTCAFGIRNCTNVQKVLDEAFRVLKPNGRFACLEFSHVDNPILKTLYDEYSFQVIPVMGQILAADWHSYQYLVESIRKFPNQKKFASMIKSAGFTFVNYTNFFGGIAAVHSGFKIDKSTIDQIVNPNSS